MLVWPQMFCPQQVVEECAGSVVGAQLLDTRLSELYHPGDFLQGLKNHAGKRKHCGKFVLSGLLGHTSCGSGSVMGSTRYTMHQHHSETKFCAVAVFRRLIFLSLVAIWVWRCNRRVRSYA